MEAFSLLKYWRGIGSGATKDGGGSANVRTVGSTTAISTAISHSAAETDDDDGDEGPFFDLAFAVPDEDDGDEHEKQTADVGDEERQGDNIDGTDGENEREEFKFTLSSSSSGDCTDPNASVSPSDDLFFNGQMIPVEPPTIVIDGSEQIAKPPFSLLKSATKFRVLMLKLKKPKANAAEKTEPYAMVSGKLDVKQEDIQNQTPKQSQSQSKLLTVKFKVEEVPIVSLFTRDNSSRASSCINRSPKKESSNDSASDEKRFSKDGMQKYLKMVQPLYIRVSKRYGEKSGFSGQLSLGGGIKAAGPGFSQKSPQFKDAEKTEEPAATSDGKSQKQGKLPARLRVLCKHLGKSRSASSSVVAVAPSGSTNLQGKRRDDSLLEQQDGIQSAILHCKRSFNASRDSESVFPGSVSDPSPKNPSN